MKAADFSVEKLNKMPQFWIKHMFCWGEGGGDTSPHWWLSMYLHYHQHTCIKFNTNCSFSVILRTYIHVSISMLAYCSLQYITVHLLLPRMSTVNLRPHGELLFWKDSCQHIYSIWFVLFAHISTKLHLFLDIQVTLKVMNTNYYEQNISLTW